MGSFDKKIWRGYGRDLEDCAWKESRGQTKKGWMYDLGWDRKEKDEAGELFNKKRVLAAALAYEAVSEDPSTACAF